MNHIEQIKAFERLILEVYRVHEGKRQIDEIFMEWRKLMAEFRATEKRCLIDREGTTKEIEGHKSIIGLMIICADAIVSVASNHLDIGYHLEEEEKSALRSNIELVSRHGKILRFDQVSWHGPLSPEEIAAASERLFCEPGRKAA